MSAIEYTLKSQYELGPFGECVCEITFCFYPSTHGDDDAVEVQSAKFYDCDYGRWRDLGHEAAANIDNHLDEHLLEFAKAKYQSDAEGMAEDHAYAADESWMAVA